MSNALLVDENTQIEIPGAGISEESAKAPGLAADESVAELKVESPESPITTTGLAVADETICADLNSPDPVKKGRGLEQAYEKYGLRLVQFLKWKVSALSIQDRQDIVHDTFVELWQTAQAQGLDPGPPLPSLLFQRAFRNAIDLIRKMNRRTPTTEMVERIVESIHSNPTEIGQDILATAECAENVRRLFEQFVCDLPPQQKVVGQAVADNWPDHLSLPELREAIHQTTGTNWTDGQVTGAWNALVKKFRKCVRNKIDQ